MNVVPGKHSPKESPKAYVLVFMGECATGWSLGECMGCWEFKNLKGTHIYSPKPHSPAYGAGRLRPHEHCMGGWGDRARSYSPSSGSRSATSPGLVCVGVGGILREFVSCVWLVLLVWRRRCAPPGPRASRGHARRVLLTRVHPTRP